MGIENLNSVMNSGGSADSVDELQLSRYLEGRLDTRQRQEVEQLLKSSAAARRRLDALREEERLLREALENLSQPSRRLGDKVIAVLHNEERFRQQAQRARKIRRNVFAAIAAAACLILSVFLFKPRDAMGTMPSGNMASVVTPGGDHRTLTKNGRAYEGDTITTGQGQFIRLNLSNDAVLDIDEHSKIVLEKTKPAIVKLESGRIGISCANQDVVIHVPQGTVRCGSNSLLDIWLPQRAEAKLPEMLDTLTPVDSKTQSTTELPAVVTVLSGNAYVAHEAMPAGVAFSNGHRIQFTSQNRLVRKVDIANSRVIETRRGRSWHTLDGATPQDRAVVGLLETPDFKDLGTRLGMTKNAPQEIATALDQLQQAQQIKDPTERAKKLAAAQQALRLAYEPFKADDERRGFGRTLEGLAHLERGRALVTSGKQEENAAASAAFDAARVAFEEALKFETDSVQPPAPAATRPDWVAAIAAGPGVTLKEMSPLNQSRALATFNHAVARYWGVRVSENNGTEGEQAAREFSELRANLGRSIEGISARLAEGLVLKQVKGMKQRAIDAFEEVLAISAAGLSDNSQKNMDGIRQLALLSLVRLYAENSDMEKARVAEQDLRILFPLENAHTNAVLAEINRILEQNMDQRAEEAFKNGKYELALELYDEWLRIHGNEAPHISARLNVVRALIATKSGIRARNEINALLEQKEITPEIKAQLEELRKEADAIPTEQPAEKIIRVPLE